MLVTAGVGSGKEREGRRRRVWTFGSSLAATKRHNVKKRNTGMTVPTAAHRTSGSKERKWNECAIAIDDSEEDVTQGMDRFSARSSPRKWNGAKKREE
jgi:hypothetical protein